MQLIDTHNHIYLDDFDPEQDKLIAEAQASGIAALLLPNVDTTTIERMNALVDRYPQYLFPMMGLHPTSVATDYAAALKETEAWLERRSYCAIGEIGIDMYWDTTYLKEQKAVFEEQLRWSIDLNLPVAIHTRNAYPEVFDSIYKVGAEKLRGVFHCFTGTLDEWKEIEKLKGFMIGVNGVVTFKNSKLPDVLLEAGLERLVLETDAPYLAPVPYRGKRNEPVYIWETAKKVAQIFGISVENIVEITKENALKTFPLVNIPI